MIVIINGQIPVVEIDSTCHIEHISIYCWVVSGQVVSCHTQVPWHHNMFCCVMLITTCSGHLSAVHVLWTNLLKADVWVEGQMSYIIIRHKPSYQYNNQSALRT